jgi:hypothetical protein
MRLRWRLWLSMLMVSVAWSADVTGKWMGSMVLEDGNRGPAYLRLKQTGGVVTGSQGPSDEKQFPITSGRIEGSQVTTEARPGPAVLRLTMKLEGNKLTGEVFEDDRKIGTVSLQKVDE